MRQPVADRSPRVPGDVDLSDFAIFALNYTGAQ